MTRLAGIALVLTLAFPAAAGAATWTAPEKVAGDLSGPTCCPDFGFSDAGKALAVFTTQSIESHTSGALTSTRFITRTAGGEWNELVEGPGYPKTFRAHEQSVTADGHVLIFGTPARFKPYRDHPTGLAVRHGHLTASGVSFDSTELLRKGAVSSYDFAANRAGDAVVAWGVRKGKHRGVFVRRAKGAGEFGKVKRLTKRVPRFRSVLVDVGRNGHVVVTWARGDRMFARIGAPDGGFGQRLGLGRTGAYTALAAGPAGQMLVARVRPPIRKAKLLATHTGPNGIPSKTDVLAGPDQALYTTSPLVAFDRAARGLVAWTDGGTHVATLTGGDPRVEPVDPGGLVQDMAVSPAGHVAIVLASAAGLAGYVALRGPSGSFAPGERASPDGVRPDGAQVAFDPSNGEPVVLYLSNTGQGEPIDVPYAVARRP